MNVSRSGGQCEKRDNSVFSRNLKKQRIELVAMQAREAVAVGVGASVALAARAARAASAGEQRRRHRHDSTVDGARSKRPKAKDLPHNFSRHTCSSHISRPRGAHIHVHVHVAAPRARCAPREQRPRGSRTFQRDAWTAAVAGAAAALRAERPHITPLAFNFNTWFRFSNIVE